MGKEIFGPPMYKIVKGHKTHYIEPSRWDTTPRDPNHRDYDAQLDGYERQGGVFRQELETAEYVEVEKA